MITAQVSADTIAKVYVQPSQYNATKVGETFTIKINISDVTDLAGYDFKLYYNNTLLKALSIDIPPGHFLTPTTSKGRFYVQAQDIHQNFNSTHGEIRVAALLLNEPSKSGNGTLTTVTFNATALGGPYPLQIAYPGYPYPVKLSTPESVAIPCVAEGGWVKVGITIVPGQALIYIVPSTYTVSRLLETFTMNVTIANATNLYSYEYKLFYDKTIVQALSADLPSDHFLKPTDPTKILTPPPEVNNNYNSTHGRIWFNASLLAPETAKSGNGSLTVITFKAVGNGSTFVRFEDTKLNTPTPVTPISHATKDAQIISNLPIIPPIPSVGRMIDLFTQKEPYSGKGINKSSDAFAPQSEVILYANVTYRGDPVQNKQVSFEVTPPNPIPGYPLWIPRAPLTNASGIANMSFRIPHPTHDLPEDVIFGTWYATASVTIGDEKVVDTLTFRVGRIVEILSIETIDQDLKPKTHFAKGTCVGAKLHLRNIAMTSRIVDLVVTAYDNSSFSFDSIVWNEFTVEPGETYIYAYCFLNISEHVTIGDAKLIATAYNPQLEIPEAFARFVITSRNVAVINVVTSSVDVISGQIVNIMVTVKNNGGEVETFPVSVYYGPFLVQSLFVESLSPNQNRTLSFVWNTTYVPAESYTISGVAGVVPGETETGDNTYVDGSVTVRVPRIFMFPRELSIVALLVAAVLALFAMILLLTRRKKKNNPEPAMLTVDVIPS